MLKKVFAFAAFISLWTPVAMAGPPADWQDLKTGKFEGQWCGYEAQFLIQTKDKGKWVFHGKVTFSAYPGVADDLWIEQYQDATLRMIRYLSGSQAGRTQVVQTQPATEMERANANYAEWRKSKSFGPDCEGERKDTQLFGVPR